MKVVILCGGKGTRLREETEFRPKPMVPIGDRPILWHIMKTYSRWGHRDFILCLGYKGEMIKEYFRNYLWNTCDVTVSLGRESSIKYHNHHDEEDWTVTLAETGAESGTGHRVRQIQRYIAPGEPFMLTYGDGLSDVNIENLVAAHRRAGRVLTMSAVHPAGRFGWLHLNAEGDFEKFQEKPVQEANYVNGGFMVCDYRLFEYLAVCQESTMFEREPVEALVRDGQLSCFRHEGFWQPMDTYQECQHLNRLWSEGKAPWA